MQQVELLDNVGKELDGILYNLVEILSDESRQSEITVTSNDGQINAWLEQTFSSKQVRSVSSTSRFDSIKAIIQASSFVNALQRQLRQHARERLTNMFNLPVNIHQLNQWTFPMMDYSQPMLFSLLLIFDAHDLISRYRIDLDVLRNFTRALTDGYTSKLNIFREDGIRGALRHLEFRPAYHNDYHGADVLQTTHCLLIKSNLMTLFAHIEIAALVSRGE